MVNRCRDLDVTFQHIVDMPSSNCVFCSTRQRDSNRIRLFLFFNERESVYVHNGISDIWEEIFDTEAVNYLRHRFEDVIQERKIPCYAITE